MLNRFEVRKEKLWVSIELGSNFTLHPPAFAPTCSLMVCAFAARSLTTWPGRAEVRHRVLTFFPLWFLYFAAVCSFMLSRLLLWLRYKITVDAYKGQRSSYSRAPTAATGSFLSPSSQPISLFLSMQHWLCDLFLKSIRRTSTINRNHCSLCWIAQVSSNCLKLCVWRVV